MGRPDLADAAGQVGPVACAARPWSATKGEGTAEADGGGRELSRLKSPEPATKSPWPCSRSAGLRPTVLVRRLDRSRRGRDFLITFRSSRRPSPASSEATRQRPAVSPSIAESVGYAACGNSSTNRNQHPRGFQLVRIWATISKPLILRA